MKKLREWGKQAPERKGGANKNPDILANSAKQQANKEMFD
jgi:hypothetical protein